VPNPYEAAVLYVPQSRTILQYETQLWHEQTHCLHFHYRRRPEQTQPFTRRNIYAGSRPTRVSHKQAKITLPLNNPLQHPFQYHRNLSTTGTASPVHLLSPPPQPPQSATPPLHITRNVLVDSQYLHPQTLPRTSPFTRIVGNTSSV
jgi:hypothetical protein